MLGDALAALIRAAPNEAAEASAPRQPGKPEAPDEQVAATLKVIPNNFDDEGESWDEWVRIGLATYRATDGSESGFALWDRWSKKNAQRRYDADKTVKKWEGFHQTPPDRIGFGTLSHLADQAEPEWRVLVGLSDDVIDEILRLSRLSKAQYETERKEKAKQLNMRVSVLDGMIANLWPIELGSDDNRQGTRIEFEPINPWPDPVDGEVLITNMKAAIRSHVILSEHQSLATSLWIIHTHVIEAAEHSPRLQIKSPTKRCGKSTLLSVIAPMVAKPINTESITTASLFRLIEKYQPTLLIDEADSFLKRDDGRDNEEMRGILNAGHARSGMVIRTVGEDFEPRLFKVFGPVAFAWLVKRNMHVAETLEDRSITIELRRRLPSERITRLRSNRTSHLRDLARRTARWVSDHISSLIAADPDLPEELNDRAMDNWRPLIAIADAMSDDLGQKAREAAIKIAEESIGTGEEDASIMALADVAAIFEARNAAAQRAGRQQVIQLSSQDLVNDLIALEDHPWANWRRGSPLTKNSLARLLKPFRIHPKQLRFGNVTMKGYEQAPVMEAKERFVDAAEPVTEQDLDPPL
jgi:putative DNA primase/helicase